MADQAAAGRQASLRAYRVVLEGSMLIIRNPACTLAATGCAIACTTLLLRTSEE
jgi:hypothetical protein